MKVLTIIGLILVIALPVLAQDQKPVSGWPLILQDYRDGIITLDQKAQLALTLLTNPENLPKRYQIDHPMRDATTMILDVMTDKDRINPGIIYQYNLALDRLTKQKIYDTPEGHFRIHYDTTGTHVVYQATVDVNPADGVPDYVNRTGEYFERAWTFQTDTLGYDTPPPDGSSGGGTDLYDVYMHRYSGAYGVTFPEQYSNDRPGRSYDMISYIYVDPAYNGFGYTDRTLPMKVTSAHEFFHAVQMAYNANAGVWFMENCAVWMEENMWDDINDCYDYMPNFFNNPHKTLMTYDGSFEYGAFVWPTYLDERYGRDIIKTIWEFAIYNDALNSVLFVLEEFYSGIMVDYPAFATWNYITGSRNDGNHYQEASGYDQVRIMRTHNSYPVTDCPSLAQPGTLGCNYIQFSRNNHHGKLRIHFTANSGIWVVPVVKSISTNQHEFDEIILDSNYRDGEIEINGLENYVTVTIIPCLVYGTSSNFAYSAELDTLTDIEEESRSLPTEFTLRGNYPNPFNGSTIISFDAPATYEGLGSITIYDQLGRQVSTRDLNILSGQNNVAINLTSEGIKASGMYYYKIAANNYAFYGKMTYLK